MNSLRIISHFSTSLEQPLPVHHLFVATEATKADIKLSVAISQVTTLSRNFQLKPMALYLKTKILNQETTIPQFCLYRISLSKIVSTLYSFLHKCDCVNKAY